MASFPDCERCCNRSLCLSGVGRFSSESPWQLATITLDLQRYSPIANRTVARWAISIRSLSKVLCVDHKQVACSNVDFQIALTCIVFK